MVRVWVRVRVRVSVVLWSVLVFHSFIDINKGGDGIRLY